MLLCCVVLLLLGEWGSGGGTRYPLYPELQVAHKGLRVRVHVVRGVVEGPPSEHEAEQSLHQLELLALLHRLQLEHVLQRRLAEVALRHVHRRVRLLRHHSNTTFIITRTYFVKLIL